jgi:flagellar hook-associated protein 3 FlgL
MRRISESMKYSTLVRDLQAKNVEFDQTSQQLSTGLRVSRPSDDIPAYRRISRFKAAMKQQDAYMQSAQIAESQLSSADSALMSGLSVLVEARQIALQMRSSTHSPSSFQAMQSKILQLRDQMITLANTKVDDKYVFAGTSETNPAVNAAGLFVGSNNLRSVQIGDSTFVDQANGQQAFDSTVDVFAVLDTLAIDLGAQNGAGIGNALDQIDSAHEQMSASLQAVGHGRNDIEHAQAFADEFVFDTKTNLSALEDVDVAEAVIKLESARNSLEAIAQVASKRRSFNIFNQL